MLKTPSHTGIRHRATYVTEENTMFHHELFKIREAEALREAAAYRLAREARREGRGRSAADEPGRRVRSADRQDGGRTPRAYGTVA
ncbi:MULTISPECIES: hypothetical protein [Streptomyces]|nr:MULTISPECIES: hypothetical protein [Streptomyces]